MMEFTTPPSYGSTNVNVGGIVTDDKIIYAGTSNTATHTDVKKDPENGWPDPSAARFTWSGNGVEAVLEGPYGQRLDRVDIMAEVPGFVKQIVAGAAGTKPYIYQVGWLQDRVSTSKLTTAQYGPKMTLKIKENGEEKQEEGTLFTEATFITAD